MLLDFYANSLETVLGLFVFALPVLATIIVIPFLWLSYRHYKLIKDLAQKEWMLLEVRLPKEIFKSPKSMEIVTEAFSQKADWFSLELVSFEGSVHFFIRTERKYKNIIESQIYGQYPEVEVYEAEDYAMKIPYDAEKEWKLWGAELELSKDDPYPIKTYVDYGMDNESLKEETKVDPISSVIEMLGALGRDEFAFVQILVMATQERYKVKGKWFEKQGWKDEGKDLIKEMMEKSKPKDGDSDVGVLRLTPGDQEVIKAVERNISKTGFDCGGRVMYVARKDVFSESNKIAMGNIFSQYGSLNLNGFKVSDDLIKVKPKWTDRKSKKSTAKKMSLLDAYRRRSYFYPPYIRKPFVLNTEELATIYHFPGGVITTPTVERISSKKVQPPSDLPV